MDLLSCVSLFMKRLVDFAGDAACAAQVSRSSASKDLVGESVAVGDPRLGILGE
jgi:hypothetical protein